MLWRALCRAVPPFWLHRMLTLRLLIPFCIFSWGLSLRVASLFHFCVSTSVYFWSGHGHVYGSIAKNTPYGSHLMHSCCRKKNAEEYRQSAHRYHVAMKGMCKWLFPGCDMDSVKACWHIITRFCSVDTPGTEVLYWYCTDYITKHKGKSEAKMENFEIKKLMHSKLGSFFCLLSQKSALAKYMTLAACRQFRLPAHTSSYSFTWHGSVEPIMLAHTFSPLFASSRWEGYTLLSSRYMGHLSDSHLFSSLIMILWKWLAGCQHGEICICTATVVLGPNSVQFLHGPRDYASWWATTNARDVRTTDISRDGLCSACNPYLQKQSSVLVLRTSLSWEKIHRRADVTWGAGCWSVGHFRSFFFRIFDWNWLIWEPR